MIENFAQGLTDFPVHFCHVRTRVFNGAMQACNVGIIGPFGDEYQGVAPRHNCRKGVMHDLVYFCEQCVVGSISPVSTQ